MEDSGYYRTTLLRATMMMMTMITASKVWPVAIIRMNICDVSFYYVPHN